MESAYQRDTCAPMWTAALFTTAKWNPQWINSGLYRQELILSHKKNEILTFAAKQMKLENETQNANTIGSLSYVEMKIKRERTGQKWLQEPGEGKYNFQWGKIKKVTVSIYNNNNTSTKKKKITSPRIFIFLHCQFD